MSVTCLWQKIARLLVISCSGYFWLSVWCRNIVLDADYSVSCRAIRIAQDYETAICNSEQTYSLCAVNITALYEFL